MSSNMFLDLRSKTADGESEDSGHISWVEVSGWSHGFEQPTNPARSQSAVTIEKCTHNPFEVTRKLDVASVPLMKACWCGRIWDKIVFNAYRASEAQTDPILYLSITMEYAVIASFSITGGEGEIPEETISFNYGAITYKYTPANKKTLEPDTGKMKVHKHDLITNKVE